MYPNRQRPDSGPGPKALPRAQGREARSLRELSLMLLALSVLVAGVRFGVF